jgi:hypothetical protein
MAMEREDADPLFRVLLAKCDVGCAMLQVRPRRHTPRTPPQSSYQSLLLVDSWRPRGVEYHAHNKLSIRTLSVRFIPSVSPCRQRLFEHSSY